MIAMTNMALLLPQTPLPDKHSWATVTQASPLRIRVDGEATAIPFTPGSLAYGLEVGDRVLLAFTTNDDPQFLGRRVTVLGRAGGFAPYVPPPDLSMVRIDEHILSGTTGSVTFSSIPGTFRSLRIVTQARGDFAATSIAWGLRFNGDTSAVYNFQQLLVSGTSVSGSQAQGETRGYLGEISASSAPSGAAATHDIVIANYAAAFWKSATTTMTMTAGTGAGGMHTRQLGTLWRNTAAITSITLLPDSGNLIAGSTFTLYGMP